MTKPATAMDLWMAGFKMCKIGAEAQMVIGMRVAGMMGLWSVTPSEDRRMVSEKTTAFADAGAAMASAAARGQRPDQILVAGMAPIGAKTASNVKRLSKRGPKLPPQF